VALLLPRSIELALAVMGVWKTGAAYIALDVNDSPERTQQLIDASGATLVIRANDLETGASSRGSSTSTKETRLPKVEVASTAAVWLSPREAGKPVVVGISHLALASVLSGLQDRMHTTRADIVLSLGPVAAPLLPVELFLPLIHGACAALAKSSEAGSPHELQRLLKRTRATTVIATPASCSTLLEALPAGQTIPRILCERSAFGATTIAQLLARTRELWALHSYVETSGCTSVRRIQEAHDLRLLGEPLANTRFRVLDASLACAPIDACGELYVGGNLGSVDDSADPEEARFVFVPAGSADERLFKTGDQARIRRDGVVEIIDRKPAPEVEAAQLPESGETSEVDPELESRLRAIWAPLLGIDESAVDAKANFFELGGHSLLAARMLTRVEAQFGRRVTLASLFRAPTVRGLAKLLVSDAREFDFRQIVQLQADGAKIPLIAINNTGVYYLLAKRLGPQQPVTSLQVFDPSAKHATLPQTLEQIATEYVKLIQRVHPTGPYVLAGWCVAGALAFEIARQLCAAGARVSQVFLMDSWAPGYFSRLCLPRRWIGGNSLRWQLTRADWRRYRSGQQSFMQFLEQRHSVQKLQRLWKRLSARTSRGQPTDATSGQEQYDKWLLEYLQITTKRYQPKPYSGRVTLFRSTLEPTGWLFDPLAGWGEYAQGGVDLVMVEGNHFTMFQDPGAAQMARHMGPLIG
jgi:thioesterase domain-containing protein/acyl carrier protein